MTWLLLAGAILTEVAATLSLRASEGLRKKIWIAPVAVFYIAAFSLLTVALANGMPVGIAYGIWAACGVALTAVGARVFFKERLTARMIAGIGLIAVGVLVIELGSQAH
ncbi:multidrug efflux SMR transporter [Agreia sp. COWG]|uniref:DMT family transporter n=1 Tax=Agreia sp. COWG TaxID=2773266 RepID=UPI001927B6AB|nr:multidrug efflux SMR transporter [Agreia sp. COWG]CAD6008155.1 QacE family quaternary ammonium compound efflux SMR transporter [Agreia sp. COWG]